MARILLAGDRTGIAGRGLLDRLAARLRAEGHDAAVAAEDTDAAQAVQGCDAVLAVVDGSPDPQACALLGAAKARGRVTFALHTRPLPAFLAPLLSGHHAGASEADLLSGLPAFTRRVAPFAGRLVRDQVPKLVREAGHQVQFRELPEADRAGFLKRKISEEARELEEAAAEPEEIADLLEALEALIRVRGYDREELKRAKQSKLSRRGGFERFYVVESTAAAADERPVLGPLPGTTA